MKWASIILVALKLFLLLARERQRDKYVNEGIQKERASALENLFREVRAVADLTDYYDRLTHDERERLRDEMSIYGPAGNDD